MPREILEDPAALAALIDYRLLVRLCTAENDALLHGPGDGRIQGLLETPGLRRQEARATVRETLLALLPLVLGLLWTIGLMRVFDLQFTMANVWGLPLIIGASAEFGLNVMVRYLEGRDHGGLLVARSTVMAVDGAVVSKPMAMKMTRLPGLARAIFSESSGE